MATQIDRLYLDHEDEAPKEVFQNWLGSLRTALQDISPTGVIDFTNVHPEELEVVPTNRRIWFSFLRDRLSRLLSYQAQKIQQDKANHLQLGS